MFRMPPVTLQHSCQTSTTAEDMGQFSAGPINKTVGVLAMYSTFNSETVLGFG